MVGMIVKKQSPHLWWFDNQSKPTSTRSPWLQSTLGELDHKTEAMLKLIEADADSFAQRAEMYYKKRPELISMVEEFYRSHKSLAEKHDQAKAESGGTRVLTTLSSPFSATKYHHHQLEKSPSISTFRSYDCLSEVCDEYAESEVDDPEDCVTLGYHHHREITKLAYASIEDEDEDEDELRRLREEIARLGEENRAYKVELEHKDEEKREAIRHLSFAVDMLKQENVALRKLGGKVKEVVPKKTSVEFSKIKEGLFGKWFNGSSQNQKIPVREVVMGDM